MSDSKIKQLRAYDLAAFFESFSMLLHAGVPANEAADIIASDMEGGHLAVACKRLNDILSGGEVFVLSEAMDKSAYFPPYAVEMTRLGEESGRLESTSEQLGEYFRRQDSLQQSIRSAVSGPVLLMMMMGVVLIFLLSFVLPVFENVFATMGQVGSSGIGGAFLAARVAMVVVGALLAAILLLLVVYILPGGHKRMARLAERLPFTKNVYYAISASRFTNGIAMLLASGISTEEAIDKAGVLVENDRISKRLAAARSEVASGEDLGKALVNSGVLEGFEAKILLSASRAGQTESAMRNLSAVYAEEAENGIDRLLGMIEPALVGVLSVAIGIILLTVMFPLTTILTSIN